MRRKSKPTNLSLSDYLNSYDPKSLDGAISMVQNSFAWDLLRSYLKHRQREFEIAAMDLTRHTSQVQEAAFASGYAQAMDDLAERFIDEFRRRISGNNGAIHNPPPVEEVETVGE